MVLQYLAADLRSDGTRELGGAVGQRMLLSQKADCCVLGA
jgi:hypothetical protein